MAMYYYARKLSKGASSSSKTSYSKSSQQQQQQGTPPKTISVPNRPLPQGQDLTRDMTKCNGHVLPPCCAGLRGTIPIPSSTTLNRSTFTHPQKLPQWTNRSSQVELDLMSKSFETGSGTCSGECLNVGGLSDNEESDEENPEQLCKSESLVFKGSQLVSGTWEALIELLLPTESHFPDQDYLFAFLLCSRLYAPPHQLLNSIFNEFSTKSSTNAGVGTSSRQDEGNGDISRGEDNNGDHHEDDDDDPHPHLCAEDDDDNCCSEVNLEESRVHLLIQFLRVWTELLPYDFRDERVMEKLRIISRISFNINSQIHNEVSKLLATLGGKINAMKMYEANLRRIRTEASIGEPGTAPSVITICPSVTTMAEQLTLVEVERFSYIGPQEFVAQLLLKERTKAGKVCAEDGGACDTTRNLDAFIAWFNRLSFFVASEVCKWSKICCADLIDLQTAMDPHNNFSAYRTMYKTAVWSSLSLPDESHNYKILVPYFSLLLRDLYNLNSTYHSVLSSGHINLEKFHHLAKLIKEIISWKSVHPNFRKLPPVFNAAQTLPIFNEEELCRASYNCEHADSFQEREQFTRLQRQIRSVPLKPLNASSSSAERVYHV